MNDQRHVRLITDDKNQVVGICTNNAVVARDLIRQAFEVLDRLKRGFDKGISAVPNSYAADQVESAHCRIREFLLTD